jgi:hypothetical protein
MDKSKKTKLLKELDPTLKDTAVEAAFLITCENDFVPMWERAKKPIEQVAQERAELLTQERRKVRKLEAQVAAEYSFATGGLGSVSL